MGNIGPVQLLIVLAIVVLIFGGKRLRSLGSDIGASIKGFKEATREQKDEADPQAKISHETDSTVIDVQVREKNSSQN